MWGKLRGFFFGLFYLFIESTEYLKIIDTLHFIVLGSNFLFICTEYILFALLKLLLLINTYTDKLMTIILTLSNKFIWSNVFKKKVK